MGCCASSETGSAKDGGNSPGARNSRNGRQSRTVNGSRTMSEKAGGGSKVNNIPLFGDSVSITGSDSGRNPATSSQSLTGTTNTLKRFTLRELQSATGKFKKDNELGEGSFGKVYRGNMEDWLGEYPPGQKRMVAVKVLDENSFQGFGEWMAEVLLLGRLQHPNLVRLLGYSTDKDEAILVYEYLHNGSLENWLFSTKKRPLSWEERMRIALNATEGLGYLHAQNIIHRDFKSCNILLDNNLVAKLTDFGMATTGPEQGQTHVSTRVMGTLGYLDPKYMETGHLTPKSDIYALGVVFLELLTGRPPTAEEGEEGDEGARLTTWIRPHLSTRRPDLSIIMDPRLDGKFSPVGAHKMLVLAKHCVSDDPAARPQIVEMLKTIKQVAELATSTDDQQGTAQQQQQQLNSLQKKVESDEESVGTLMNRTNSDKKKKLPEDLSFDATKKVFGDVLSPR